MEPKSTSVETYHRIKEEGLLSKLRFYVYDIIYHNGPITISQMIRIAAKDVTNTGSFTGRISELERMSLIGQHHIGPCPVTGREVIFWQTTNNLPSTYEKPETKSDIIKRLEKEIEELRTRLEMETARSATELGNFKEKYVRLVSGLMTAFKSDKAMTLEDFVKSWKV